MSGLGTIFGGATLFAAGALAGQATLLPLAGEDLSMIQVHKNSGELALNLLEY